MTAKACAMLCTAVRQDLASQAACLVGLVGGIEIWMRRVVTSFANSWISASWGLGPAPTLSVQKKCGAAGGVNAGSHRSQR